MLTGRHPNNPICLSPEEVDLCQQGILSGCATVQKRCNVLLGLTKYRIITRIESETDRSKKMLFFGDYFFVL